MSHSVSRRLALAAPAILALPFLVGQTGRALAQLPATQAPGFYRFKVGGFVVTTVHDGFAERSLEGFVRNAPLADVQKVLADSFLPTDKFRIPFTVTFVETPAALVVFDAGNGVTPAGSTQGRMIANMVAAGIDPAKVTHVVHSHFHGDHINGLLNAQGGAAFPNAEILVPATEWTWWTDTGNETRSPEGQRGNFANTARRFGPYQGKVRPIAEGAEAVPGVRGLPAYGHTPGHTIYRVSDGNAQMIFLADTTNRPELFAVRPDYHAVFDFDPVAAEATRKRVLDMVATDRMRVTGYHFPFPAQGFIEKTASGYRFIPGDWSSTL
jgi:glyoxylase-like metal-dependent hydrolase (beta-lactamase superfamily II)